MGFFDFFRSAPQKQTLESLTLEDLNRERLTCQQELTKVEREQAKLLKDEEQLKNEYANATADFQKRSIARRIQDGRMQQKQVEGWINAVNKNLRVVNNFIMIKKNEAFYKRAGVLSILNNMDVADI
ncbi:MAG: hypothetical protein Q4C70_04660, partial [Planctomycetia bacterium]|nr:hypothetical protein [Planctomycetia bacterium]